MTLELRFAARSDVGMVRKGNEDSGYAGPHLLLVADGMGGHAFGEVASAAAVGVLIELEPARAVPGQDADQDDPVVRVREHVARAGQLLRSMIKDRPELEGMGTTVTALLHVDGRVVIAQVGDSRGYLLRDGVLEQVTHDQTFVQSLVDEGRISHDAARSHPQRSLLLQALDGRAEVEPEISVRTPLVGDRYLLCSDGLSGVLSEATMRDVLMVGTPDEAVGSLVDLALRGGAPDNVTCVVADVAEADAGVAATDDPARTAPAPVPSRLVGAAAESARPVRSGPQDATATGTGTGTGTGTTPRDGPDEPADDHRGAGRRLMLPVLLLVAVAAATLFGYRWTQQQFYVGTSNGHVAIYRGLPQHVAGLRLSSLVDAGGPAVAQLPVYLQDQVGATIPAKSLSAARTIMSRLLDQAAGCTAFPEPAGCPPGLAPTPTPSVTPTPTPSPPGTTSASPSASKR